MQDLARLRKENLDNRHNLGLHVSPSKLGLLDKEPSIGKNSCGEVCFEKAFRPMSIRTFHIRKQGWTRRAKCCAWKAFQTLRQSRSTRSPEIDGQSLRVTTFSDCTNSVKLRRVLHANTDDEMMKGDARFGPDD